MEARYKAWSARTCVSEHKPMWWDELNRRCKSVEVGVRDGGSEAWELERK